ncbi:MAG: PIN domain-containing protein [Lachnospiraceae bacterium]|nr:PIN domain-containing protein [Lachnospiraceae bacterium]
MLEAVCGLLTVTGATQEEIVKVVYNREFKDFEDCLQDKCAKAAGCDYIVTANIKDFVQSEVPAISPAEFLNIWIFDK